MIGEKAAQSLGADPEILEEMAYLYQSWGSLAIRHRRHPRRRGEIRADAGDGLQACRGSSCRAQVSEPTCRLYSTLGITLQASGRAADAIAHYRQSIADLERLEKPTPIDLYDMACCRSLISGARSEPGSGLTAAEGQAEAERAVAGSAPCLRRRLCESPGFATGDPDLKPIRSHPDFQLLMMDMTFPAQPFANSD